MNSKRWSASLIRDIVDNIQDQEEGNRIIPIIGQGVYQVNDNGKDYSIQEFIIKSILENEKIPLRPTEDNIKEYANGYRGMTELSKLCSDNGLTLLRQIKDIFSDIVNMHKISMDPDVLTFLELGEFPLILTTCNFRWLDNHITHQGNKYTVIPYRTGKDQDIKTEDNIIIEPTIFHLFGYVGQDRNVVITENDFLRYLHCIQDTNTRPEQLKKYLENKYILSLGCEIPDWTFRFLLYSLKEKEGRLGGVSGEDAFDGGALSKAMDDNLYSFLSNISYFPSQNINEFLRDVNSQLELKVKPNVFLSLCSDEYDKIGAPLLRLLSQFFDVWFYKYDGDEYQYWNDPECGIEVGLKASEFILPIITPNAIDKIDDYEDPEMSNDDTPGLIEEWKRAMKYNVKCCPLYIDRNEEKLKKAIKRSNCKDLLWSFFFSDPGNAGLQIDLNTFSAEQLYNHIKKHLNLKLS